MKIPLKWLADYVSIDMPVPELARRLTMAGLEVSSIRSYGLPVPEGLLLRQCDPGPVWDRDKVVVARIASVEKHPNADKLKLPTVEYGEGRTLKMVTGAPNISVGDVGQKVVLGMSGTSYYDGHVSPKQIKSLKPGVIRGVESSAMVMSNYELGINEEHEGIILLEEDAPVGVPAADFMGDLVLEVDVLPNMARCLSMVGVAREVAAITGTRLKPPALVIKADGPEIAGRVKVVIEDSKLSPRYAAGLIEGVKIGPAPGWMQRRLSYAGMRPINNVVDVTNYVMLEWGQPLHAFDYDVLKARAGGKAPTIIVRPAREGETLVTLDKAERKLTPDVLVIADEKGPIALAGVMGGLETEVTDKTSNVLLESASFDFVSIRRTSRAMDLPSEASMRFSKGIHPNMVPIALARASELFRQHAGGTVAKGVVDEYPAPPAARIVELKMSEVARVLGVALPIEECERILTTLDFHVERVGTDALRATVPPFRLDVQEGPADLIEDLVRLYGYDKLPQTLLKDQLPAQLSHDDLRLEESLRDRLVALGVQEAINYSLTTPEREAPLAAGDEYVTLQNPISSERTVMRRTLLSGLLDSASRNLRSLATDSVRLFEVGSVYLPRKDNKLPEEPRRLAVVMSGKRGVEFWGDGGAKVGSLDFYDLKGAVEAILADLHLPQVTYRPAKPAMLHPGKAAEVVCGERVLGVLGELHPKVAEAFDLGGKAVQVVDLDLAAIRAVMPPRFAYKPISTYPPALRDVAVVVPDSVSGERVEAEIRAAGGELLHGVRLFDVYVGESIPAGHKSLAYALSYQAEDRTLTDKEVDRAHKSIEGRLRNVLKAQIRGQDA
jgi:phenylalanyl-tRNA synthetase beta chain